MFSDVFGEEISKSFSRFWAEILMMVFPNQLLNELKCTFQDDFSGKSFWMEVLCFQDRIFWLVFTWVKRTPHTNKLFEERGCGKFMDWPFFQLALKNRFARVFAWRDQDNVSQNFFVFVSCLEQWGKTVLADELQTIVYETESSFPRSFSTCALSKRFWVFWQKLSAAFSKKRGQPTCHHSPSVKVFWKKSDIRSFFELSPNFVSFGNLKFIYSCPQE